MKPLERSLVKIARVMKGGTETYGLVGPDGKTIMTRDEISSRLDGMKLPSALEDFVFSGAVEKVKERQDKLDYANDLAQFRLLPPITRTFKIICLAFNYSDQTNWVRFGKDPPKEPVIYMKSRTSLAGPFEDIVCPKSVTQLDYEGELALVISKKCKKASEDDALKYVGGYYVLNDVSARDVQFVDKQYSRAKSFDSFGPCGPWLTTPDESGDPHVLTLTTKVNGEVRQSSSTKNLVLKIERIIHSLSSVMTLEPGDIISTGTPSGTALSLSSHLKYLKDGDIVEVEIELLGKIRNRVRFVD